MSQGLDRVITLGIETAGYRDDNGRWVPGETLEHSIWATRTDKSLSDIDESGGSRSIAERSYLVRWRADLAAAVPETITVTDNGQTFNVANIVEVQERRRRFMTLEVTGETS